MTISDKIAYKKILKTIELNYKKSPNFDVIYDVLRSELNKEYDYLVDTNDNIFVKILSLLDQKIELNKIK